MGFRGPFVLIVTCLSAAGCEATPKERLEGRWVGEGVENFPPGQVPRAQGWVRGMSFEFKGSRAIVSIPAESPRQGTYEITEAGERQVLVTFLRPQGLRDQAAFQLEGENRLRWMLGDGRHVILRKTTSES